MTDFDPKEYMLFALNHFDLTVTAHEGKMIHVHKGYSIEVEGKHLYKLLHENRVIAPFDDVEELCNFIKMDMSLNEEN